jgi:cytochrome P450
MAKFAAAIKLISTYIDARINERLTTARDDFIDRLVQAKVDGRPTTR